jgi:hypothetical protein
MVKPICRAIVLGCVSCLVACVPWKPALGQDATQNLEELDKAAVAGIHYLESQRHADGSWHSETYGALRSGTAVTSLSLYALATAKQAGLKVSDDIVASATKWLVKSIHEKGYLSHSDGPDYPTYATAMFLEADRMAKLGLTEAQRRAMIEHLCASQLGLTHEIPEASPDFGGWDLQGWSIEPRETRGSNISVTASVLEALSHDESQASVLARSRAAKWLQGCVQPKDGGLHFHPAVEHEGNKAGWTDEAKQLPRSYGTATADGIRCWLALQTAADHAEFRAAVAWIGAHHNAKQVPGFESEVEDIGWRQGLRFYYYYAAAKSLSALSPDTRTSIGASLRSVLIEDQKPDGRWENDNARMREDDPLIATSFALIALAEIRRDELQSRQPSLNK